MLVLQARTTGNGFTARMNFNGGFSGSYTNVSMEGNGVNGQSGTWSTNGIALYVLNGYLTDGNSGIGKFEIMDYTQTNKHKTVLTRAGGGRDGVVANAGRWDQTAAISSLTIEAFGTSWAAGSTFNLFGIEG